MAEIRPTPIPIAIDDFDDPAPPKTDPAIKIVRQQMRRELNWQGAKMTIAMAVLAVSTAFGAYVFVIGEARAQTDAGEKAHESRIVALEQQVPQLRQEVYEQRTDLREIYKTMTTGQRSDRLERPVSRPTAADGGATP